MVISETMDGVYNAVIQVLKVAGVQVGNTVEVMNQTMVLTDPTAIIIHNPHRKFKLPYAVAELLFYLGADRRVGAMGKLASIWDQIKDENGEIESNYGTYLFNENWKKTAAELVSNNDSRRAIIPIFDKEHIGKNEKDYPCTGFVQFTIREGKLSLHWHMRSQDAIFGMANDFFAAAVILQLMRNEINEINAGNIIELGSVVFQVSSLHIYERHYALMHKPAWYNDRPAERFQIWDSVLVENSGDYAIDGDTSEDEIRMMVSNFITECTVGGDYV